MAKSRGRNISLAYRDLTELPRDSMTRLETLEHLDLSHNNFSDVRSLYGLTALHTLVLDNNNVSSHVMFPPMSSLQILWVNKNNIANLSVFIEAVSSSFPDLKHLSMMSNSAAPSFFNGGSKQDYQDYRHFVISHLHQLCHLDDTAITQQERETAEKIYGRRVSSVGRRQNSPAQRRRKRHSQQASSSQHSGYQE